MEESAESSGADGEIEIADPFENFLKNTFLPQTQLGGSGSSEILPKRAGESSSVIEVNDPFQTFLQDTFLPQSSGSESSEILPQCTKKMPLCSAKTVTHKPDCLYDSIKS